MTMQTQSKGAAIYMRLSTAQQADGTSLTEQEERTRAMANALGLDVVAVFSDVGVSGATALTDRPGGQEMLAQAEAGAFSTVLVAKLDRWSRNVAHAAQDLQTLKALGVGVNFLDLGLDTATPAGELMLNVMASFGQFERRRIRERNASGQYQVAMAGKWSGGLVPFGYRVAEDGTLEIEPEEAKVIEHAYKLRAEGKSMSQVADALNEAGFKPRQKVDREATQEARKEDPDAKPVHKVSTFRASSIQNYISPEADHYMGAGITREVPVPDTDGKTTSVTWEAAAIVEPDLWQRAVAMADSFSAVKNAGQQKWPYGLAGRIFHAEADGSLSTMYGHTRYSAKKGGNLIKEGKGKATEYLPAAPGEGTHEALRQYRCTEARKRAGAPATCTGLGEAYGQTTSAVHADRVEGAVLLFILKTLEEQERLEEYLQAAHATLVAEGADPDSVEALEASREHAQQKRTRYADMYAEGILSDADWKKRKAQTEAQLEAIDSRLKAAKKARGWRDEVQVTVRDLLNAEVRWTPEGAAEVAALEADHEPQGVQKAERLVAEAIKAVTPGAYGRTQPLTFETVAEVSRLAAIFGLTVTISERREWPEGTSERYVTQALGSWPEMAYTFSPEAPFQARTGSTSIA